MRLKYLAVALVTATLALAPAAANAATPTSSPNSSSPGAQRCQPGYSTDGPYLYRCQAQPGGFGIKTGPTSVWAGAHGRSTGSTVTVSFSRTFQHHGAPQIGRGFTDMRRFFATGDASIDVELHTYAPGCTLPVEKQRVDSGYQTPKPQVWHVSVVDRIHGCSSGPVRIVLKFVFNAPPGAQVGANIKVADLSLTR